MFSIVICSYNKVRSLEAVLKNLNYLKAPEGIFEVQVVVDGSTDGTVDFLNTFKASYPLEFHVIENSGLTKARNFGIKKSKGNYIIFCDDDVLLHPSYLKNLIASIYQKPDTIHIGNLGNIDKQYSKKIIEDSIANKALDYNTFGDFLSHHVFFDGIKKLFFFKDNYGDFKPAVWWAVVTGGNLCIPKRYFDNIGYFDPEIRGWGPEDADLCYRFFKHGIGVTFNTNCLLFHLDHHRNSENLMQSMTKNAVHFIKKHNKPKELYTYLLFTNGKVSLKEFNDECSTLFNLPTFEIPEFYLSLKDYSEKEQILK